MQPDNDAKKTDDSSVDKKQVKAPAKKLTIIDGSEDVPPADTTPKLAGKKIKVTLHDDESTSGAGDTPAVVNEVELSSIMQAIDSTAAEHKEIDSLPTAENTNTLPQAAEDTKPDEEVDSGMTIGDAIAAAEADETSSPPLELPEEPLQDAENADEIDDSVDVDSEHIEQSEESKKDQIIADDTVADEADNETASDSEVSLNKQDGAGSNSSTELKKRSKVKTFFKNWWLNPVTKWGTIVGVFAVIALIGLIPTSRYAFLNSVGVRAKASLTVIGNENQQPLKNAVVTIANQEKSTDEQGRVSFENLKLGEQTVTVKKRGYASIENKKTLGWGSNPLGAITTTVSGTKFSFFAKDFLSSKGIANAEAISGDFNATADKDGRIVLAVDQLEDKDFEVTIKAPDYRDELLTIKPSDTTEKMVALAPSKQHIFISKRSGKFDVYKVDADGKNESLLVPATGSEREDISLLSHPARQFAALVSTRDGKRNKDGYLLSTVNIVNVKTGELQKIGQSERIQLIDWAGDRLVYLGIVDGASAANPSRSKLYSFEIGQPGAKELASANYFNGATVFKGAVYYSPSSYALPVTSAKFYKTNPDGTGLSTILDKEVWSIIRSDYDTLNLSVQQEWYELKQNSTPVKLSGIPSVVRSRVYRDSTDAARALWTDQRDGKGVLLSYDVAGKKDTVLESRAGLTQPASWLSPTTYVFRVSDGREVADYIKSTNGGDAKKLRDVTNTDMSYYYN